ncbi:hypothetical protein ACFQ0G_53330 [Streptomyces chiangmaiensis]|uniref:hypothetical protein n=1 Tax=Streptomyces chiangmaiensis TaxID=766497 RepID=UPI0031E5C0B4
MTTHSPHQTPAAASALVVPPVPHSSPTHDVSESFITALTTAVDHLEKALELGRTPTRILLPNGATVTAAQLRVWVAHHTARAQALRNQITAPHTDA